MFEFLGSVLVGSNVAEAIRGRIISTSLFSKNPYALQLAMTCALIGSSTWLMAATRYAVPVSTTHSIIGAVLGVGVAAFGPPAINWDYGAGRGFAGIVASWFISIAVSGVMAAVAYLIMKYGVLRYRNSFARALVFAPIMFGLTYGIMSLALVWKGTPKLKVCVPAPRAVTDAVNAAASSLALCAPPAVGGHFQPVRHCHRAGCVGRHHGADVPVGVHPPVPLPLARPGPAVVRLHPGPRRTHTPRALRLRRQPLRGADL